MAALLVALAFLNLAQAQLSNPVRLVGGSSSSQGRVEISHNGVWGTVCDDDWGINDANVVCRQLGFSRATSSPCCARYGQGTGQILMDNVQCTGSERSLAQCRFNGWGSNNCNHGEDAGVVCTHSTPPSGNSVRLVGGSSSSQGRVEISHNGVWGTVCDDDWGINDANVVCRQLGFSRATSSPCCARYGQGTGQILMDNVQCTGSERSLAQCRFNGWGSNNCNHGEDAGVVCTHSTPPSGNSVRLVGGSSSSQGRVEISHNGAWGTVCDDDWGINDANVVCRQLGFSRATSSPCCARYGRGTGQILMDNVQCTGSERALAQCRFNGWGSHNCNHGEDAGVVCTHSTPPSGNSVRLVGGSSSSQGRVEISHNGVWGTVCDDDWGINDANVVCRQLGFSRATSSPCCARYGQGTGQILMDNVQCTGSERSLAQCRFNGWGSHNCNHGEDAGVVCTHSTPPSGNSVRLVGGSSSSQGRVEISHNGAWGTVCDDDWGINDANVVCRQLGFSRATSSPCCARYGQGTGQILMDNVQCTGSERSLAQCRFNGWGSHNCNHGEDAGVVCTNTSPTPPIPSTPPPPTHRPTPPIIPQCGIKPHTRIVGGHQANPGDWPWQVMLVTRSGGRQFCGGTLVTPEWVITATHCVVSSTASAIKVRLGAHRRLTPDPSVEQDINIRAIYTHPQYHSPLRYSNDIALLRLDRPAVLNRRVSLACMAANSVQFPSGTTCYITGWGTLSAGGSQPDALYQAAVPLRARAECETSYPGKIHASMICAGRPQGGVDTCQGDSGGPMVCQSNGKWYLTGVTSWGYGCASAGKYGVYANVQHLKHWVYTVMTNA